MREKGLRLTAEEASIISQWVSVLKLEITTAVDTCEDSGSYNPLLALTMDRIQRSGESATRRPRLYVYEDGDEP